MIIKVNIQSPCRVVNEKFVRAFFKLNLSLCPAKFFRVHVLPRFSPVLCQLGLAGIWNRSLL